jgi:hypothetical protein
VPLSFCFFLINFTLLFAINRSIRLSTSFKLCSGKEFIFFINCSFWIIVCSPTSIQEYLTGNEINAINCFNRTPNYILTQSMALAQGSSATNKYSLMADLMLSIASSSVAPWDQQPGIPGTDTE